MALSGEHTYVGFGFGAIQAGLFLYEAFQSGAFRRLVVAEVIPDVVAGVRGANGAFSVNIAHTDRVERATIGPIEIEDPNEESDRERLVEAVAEAQEIGTAVPSVSYYVSPGSSSLHRILAEGLRRKAAQSLPRAVIYTAENHNHAAEILQARVFDAIPPEEHEAVRSRVRFLNSVIGKMSGTVTSRADIERLGLLHATEAADRAYLVEAFNRILISQIDFADGIPFRRGIGVFQEKPDLLPFEEAKLYGHNATHALLAYLAETRRLPLIADLRAMPTIIEFARDAFVEESGAALCQKYAGVDPLFTPEGYRAYADDLLVRMTNPYLHDTTERVGRDPARKLGWDDRLIGVMRLALAHGITPRRYALGAAAALEVMSRHVDKRAQLGSLTRLWGDAVPIQERDTVLGLIADAQIELARWISGGTLTRM